MDATAVSPLWKAAAVTTIALALGDAAAQQHNPAALLQVNLARVSLAELEQAFWTCDYVATVHGATADTIVDCSAIYDALKQRKFDGDFDRLLAWWERDKPAQFVRLAALERRR